EVAGAGCDVDHVHVFAEVVDRDDLESRVRLHRKPIHVHLARDGGPVVDLLETGRAESHERVSWGEIRASIRSACRSDDMLPTAIRQEPMVAARDDRGAVGESDAISALSRIPGCVNGRAYVTAICAPHLGAIDFV